MAFFLDKPECVNGYTSCAAKPVEAWKQGFKYGSFPSCGSCG